MKRAVALVGFSGAGKTSVGAALRSLHGWTWVDIDAEVERRVGTTISELVRTEGEPYFRKIERESIIETLRNPPDVLTLGGGALLDETTKSELLERCFVVHLQVSAETAARRVAAEEEAAAREGRSGVRPLLSSGGGSGEEAATVLSRVTRLMKARHGLYDGAHLVLDTDVLPPEELAGRIVEAVRRDI